jgi:hypothetical protein
MATPARTSILLAIKSALEGITVANGYKTDVNNVDPYLRPSRDVGDAERPHICFGSIDVEPYKHKAYDSLETTIKWLAVGNTAAAATWAAMSEDVNDLLDDIIAAIVGADDTLGENAVSTYLLWTDTSEADSQWHEGGYCFACFETKYNRDTTST